jgi:two-component system, OmpR family, heavy metal sensor histidine kinase CusS
MRRLAFRMRIALLSALISGAVLMAFGATAWYLLCQERLSALDREIRALAYRYPGWMGGRANYERLSSVIEMVFGEDRKEQLILMAKNTGGPIQFISPHWPKGLNPESLDLHLEDNPNVAPAADQSRAAVNDPGNRSSSSRRGGPGFSGNESGGGFGGGFGRQRGGGAPPLVFSTTPRFFTVNLESSHWRLGVLGNEEDRLVLGLNLSDLQAELGRMRNAFLLALPLALLVIGWGGWWVAGCAVRPLRSIAQVAERVTAQGLDQRIPLSNEDPEIAAQAGVLKPHDGSIGIEFSSGDPV